MSGTASQDGTAPERSRSPVPGDGRARDAAGPEDAIAFLRMADHPIPNRLLPERLAAAFAHARIDVHDAGAAAWRDPVLWLLNPIFMLLEHGSGLLRGRVGLRSAYFTTSLAFRRMSRSSRRFVAERGPLFSFQIQSLFDGRSGDTPHFVYTDHTHLTNLDYADFDPQELRSVRWIRLERRLYESARLVFTRSENVSRTLRERYGLSADRVSCVGAGSNADPPERVAPPTDEAPPMILFVGRDWERKGGPELLDAFRRVRDRWPEARLRIVGSRPEVSEPGVEVLGRCPLEAVRRHYEQASIFCLPSRREPFGVAYVEAMHYGLPVVGTRMGAAPEIVEEGATGYLVEVGDVSGLAERLERLIADPERRAAMGARARERARERFTWEAVARRLAATIESALRAGAPTRRPRDAARSAVGEGSPPPRLLCSPARASEQVSG